VNHGSRLELLRAGAGGLESVCVDEAFGVIRSMCALRPVGSSRDLLAVGSDSGQLSVLCFDGKSGHFSKLRGEKFGKSGCRRAVAGQYVASDPSGRAVMVAAVEKQKLVYMVTRDNEENLVVASPLEANKQETLTFACEALHVGLDNPVFACLEVTYSAAEPRKTVVLYEVEEGLNHVVRKAVRPTLRSANLIVPVPGGADGPGGLLVCGDGWIEYQPLKVETNGVENTEGFLRLAVPRRNDVPADRGVLMVSHVLTHRKIKDRVIMFFILQNEYGDLYRLDLDLSEDRQTLNNFSIKYFDTVPVARSLCLTRRGLLFLASECGGHKLYKLAAKLGADEDTARASAVRIKPDSPDYAAPAVLPSTSALVVPTFDPRPHRNIHFVDALDSLSPCTGMQVEEMFGEDRQQIFLACGRGSRSSVRVMRYGLEVTEMASSQLPGNPSAVWTVRAEDQSQGDKYIVVSFANVTLVLAVGETVEEATNTGLITSKQTLAVKRCASGGIIQVCSDGVHLAKNGSSERIFSAPPGKNIDCAAINERQLAVALEGGRIHYFELNEAGSMVESAVHESGEDVKCLEIGALPAGRTRSNFLCVGTFSNTVEMLSLQADSKMKQLSLQALPDQPSSICLVYLENAGLTLSIGLRSGVLVRSQVNEHTGKVTDSRTSVLGNTPVRCFPVQLPLDSNDPEEEKRQIGMLALSSRPALVFSHHGQSKLVPLSYRQLSHASSFESEICDGFVAIAGETLQILSIEDLSSDFNAKTIPLRYTPRGLLRYRNNLVTIEGDHNVLPQKDDGIETHAMQDDDDDENMDEEEVRAAKAVTIQQTGLPKAGKGNTGRWASLVRVINPASTLSTTVPLDEDEVALCCTVIGDALVVGTVVGLELHPQRHRKARLRTFKFVPSGTSNLLKLELVHVTEVEGQGMPRAICTLSSEFVAVGIGAVVRIYSIGSRKLLRKTELRVGQTTICSLHSRGDRIFASDAAASSTVLKFSAAELTLASVADDIVPRLSVATEVLDYDTVAGSDKLGNFFVLRVPADLDASDLGALRTANLWEQTRNSGGAPNKLDALTNFYLGDLITSLKKACIVQGRSEALIYSTAMGSVGCFVPFATKGDVEFFSLLEMHLRALDDLSLVGRDHLAFRSCFTPVKGVVDGMLCEQFKILPTDKQDAVAKELDRTPAEIIKKLEDMRALVLLV